MRSVRRHTRARAFQLAAAAALGVFFAAGLPAISQAAPTHADVVAAKQKLAALIAEQGRAVEAYDGAVYHLSQVEAALANAQAQMKVDAAQARHYSTLVAQGATAAYESTGSELALLLNSTSLAQLSDKVQFLQTLSQQNRDAAAKATVAQERYRQDAQRLARAVVQQRALVREVAQRKAQVEQSIASQQRFVKKVEREYKQSLLPPPAPATGPNGTSVPPGLPPPPSAGASIAIAAARSVLGDPYVFGAAGPTAFDCSGLTMWSWAHAGVMLPHFAAAQYAMLPKVPQSDLQPGDLVFFDNLGHVGLYIGNGLMIDAPYTGTVVRVDPVWWAAYYGAGRP